MAWIVAGVAGVGGLYLLDQAYTVVYDNTVKPITEWKDRREKEKQENERIEREKIKQERREALTQKHNEIREKFGIPKRDKTPDTNDPACWAPWTPWS